MPVLQCFMGLHCCNGKRCNQNDISQIQTSTRKIDMSSSINSSDPIPPWSRAKVPTALLCRALGPILGRIVRKVSRQHPEVFDRLGPHQKSNFIISPNEFPFALHLRPDPAQPILRAVAKTDIPPHNALIEGRFFLLLQLVDENADGDAAFFSRDLYISGDTEAVVSLRNALDDVDGSIAAETADLFGPLGRIMLSILRKKGVREWAV